MTSTSSILPEPFGSELKADLLMAEGSRVAARIFKLKDHFTGGVCGKNEENRF